MTFTDWLHVELTLHLLPGRLVPPAPRLPVKRRASYGTGIGLYNSASGHFTPGTSPTSALTSRLQPVPRYWTARMCWCSVKKLRIKIASLYRFIQKLYHNSLGVPVIMTHRVVFDNFFKLLYSSSINCCFSFSYTVIKLSLHSWLADLYHQWLNVNCMRRRFVATSFFLVDEYAYGRSFRRSFGVWSL